MSDHSDLHALWPAADAGHAGARHFDQAQRHHERDELVDLVGLAGDLEDEARGSGIDDAGAEGIGQAQRLDALLALAATFTMASSRASALPCTVRSATECTGTMRSSWCLICSITAGVPVVTMVMRETCFSCWVSETVSELML